MPHSGHLHPERRQVACRLPASEKNVGRNATKRNGTGGRGACDSRLRSGSVGVMDCFVYRIVQAGNAYLPMEPPRATNRSSSCRARRRRAPAACRKPPARPRHATVTAQASPATRRPAPRTRWHNRSAARAAAQHGAQRRAHALRGGHRPCPTLTRPVPCSSRTISADAVEDLHWPDAGAVYQQRGDRAAHRQREIADQQYPPIAVRGDHEAVSLSGGTGEAPAHRPA